MLDPLSLAQILGVSVDSPFSHLAWVQTGKLTVLGAAQSC